MPHARPAALQWPQRVPVPKFADAAVSGASSGLSPSKEAAAEPAGGSQSLAVAATGAAALRLGSASVLPLPAHLESKESSMKFDLN